MMHNMKRCPMFSPFIFFHEYATAAAKEAESEELQETERSTEQKTIVIDAC
jgi:hypothetical protein